MSASQSSTLTSAVKWELKPETEFRFEVPPAELVTVKLLAGTAEIFGAELCLGKQYSFSGVKYAVFTFDGATIEVNGKCQVEYVSTECVVPFYMNLHLCLEKIRNTSLKEKRSLPRVLVLGTGRNSCVRTLVNYSIRQEKFPLVADLDVLNGNLLLPGAVSCALVNRLIEPEEEINTSNPLAFYYGSPNWTDNSRYFCEIIKSLSVFVDERINLIEQSLPDDSSSFSGLIGIFPSWTEGKSDELLKITLKSLKINVLVVVGNERLYNSIKKEHETEHLSIISISKVSGLVSREVSFRRYQTSKRIREYFYGFNDEYYPYSHVLNIKDIEIWKIEDGIVAPTSALPIGAERKLETLSISRIDITPALTYSILGISQVKLPSQESSPTLLSQHSVYGFIYVTEVDLQKEKITFLCTCPGTLPNNIFIAGNIKWIEEHKHK